MSQFMSLGFLRVAGQLRVTGQFGYVHFGFFNNLHMELYFLLCCIRWENFLAMWYFFVFGIIHFSLNDGPKACYRSLSVTTPKQFGQP